MTNINKFVVALLMVLLTGCASVSEQKEVLVTKDVNISTYSDMQYSVPALDQAQSLTLSNDSPLFAFPNGKRYFSAASLPATQQLRFITYQSSISGSILSRNVLIPRFAFLDANKQLMEVKTATEHRQLSATFFKSLSYEGRVSVPAAATHVVIYAADKIDEPLLVALASAGEMSYTVTTQEVATIYDSGITEGSKKAQLFMVTEVDGQEVPNAYDESSKASKGAGPRLIRVYPSRDVPIKALKLKLLGTHITGAPIHALFSLAKGTFYSVNGVVDFTPVAGAKYVVKGELKPEGSAVWIEDQATGKIVSAKVVGQ